MAGRAELSEEKIVFSKIMMVFFIKRNVLSRSPSPCQVMRFGKCVLALELWFSVWYLESFYGKLYFTNTFDQERNLNVHEEDYGKGNTVIYFFFYKTWLKMLMWIINSPYSGQQRKYCSLLFSWWNKKTASFSQLQHSVVIMDHEKFLITRWAEGWAIAGSNSSCGLSSSCLPDLGTHLTWI